MPGPPSLRTGIEITNNYQPVSWMRFDADLALTRARFIGPDTAQQELFDSLTGFPQAQIGNAPGNFIPEAPWMVASAGITLGERTGWFSTLRWRYISSRPLTEDGVFQSPPVNTINGRVGYQFANGWRIQLDALNLLNSSSYNASYAYGALLPSDALFAKCFPASGAPTVPAAVCQNGFMDYSIHPLDPTAVRLTLAGPIDTIDIPRMAAEFKRALPTYQPPAPNYDWTGFYVGAYVDNSWLKSNSSAVNNVTGAPFPATGLNSTQWGGGVQLGFDYMLPSRVVLGVAADMSSGGTKTATVSDPSGISANQTTVFDSETIRGRIGYAADNILFYATGGFAWSNDQFVRTQLTGTLNNATAGADEAVNKGLLGWTGGGGIAYAFAQNWNVFAEYRYTSFGTSTAPLPLSQLTTTTTTTVSAVEFGVNYKFTSSGQFAGAPPAASCGSAVTSSGLQIPTWSLYLRLDRDLFWRRRRFRLDDIQGNVVGRHRHSFDALQLPREWPSCRAFRGRQLSNQQGRVGGRRRLAMVQFARQQPNTCAAWRCRHFSVGAFYDFDHGEGLRLSPRPLGIGV